MRGTTLKRRLAALEQQVAILQMSLSNGPRADDWHRTIGMFTDDPGMLALFDEALKVREANRARARRRRKANSGRGAAQ